MRSWWVGLQEVKAGPHALCAMLALLRDCAELAGRLLCHPNRQSSSVGSPGYWTSHERKGAGKLPHVDPAAKMICRSCSGRSAPNLALVAGLPWLWHELQAKSGGLTAIGKQGNGKEPARQGARTEKLKEAEEPAFLPPNTDRRGSRRHRRSAAVL